MNREMLHSYFDGELTPAERASVEAWMATDPDAARELDALRAIDGALDGWIVDASAETSVGASALADSVLASATTPVRSRGRLLRLAGPLAAAAAILVAVVISMRGGTEEANGSVIDSQDYMQYVWEADAETYGSLALDDLESQILAELEAT